MVPVWPKCSTPSDRVRWPCDGAEPGERRRMAIDDRDQRAMRRHIGEQTLDVAPGMDKPVLARPLRRGPAGIEPIGRGYGEQPDIAPVLRHQAHRLDRFRRHGAGIDDDNLRIRPRLAHPIAAIDDVLAELRRHRAAGCSIGRVDSLK